MSKTFRFPKLFKSSESSESSESPKSHELPKSSKSFKIPTYQNVLKKLKLKSNFEPRNTEHRNSSEELLFNNYNNRKRIYSVENIKNLPLLYAIKKSGVYSLGTVHIYSEPLEYIESNVNIKKNLSNTKNDPNIELLYYMLNNFLYSKSENEKNGKKTYEYELKIFPFEESLEQLNTMMLDSDQNEIDKLEQEIKRLEKTNISNKIINNLKQEKKYKETLLLKNRIKKDLSNKEILLKKKTNNNTLKKNIVNLNNKLIEIEELLNKYERNRFNINLINILNDIIKLIEESESKSNNIMNNINSINNLIKYKEILYKNLYESSINNNNKIIIKILIILNFFHYLYNENQINLTISNISTSHKISSKILKNADFVYNQNKKSLSQSNLSRLYEISNKTNIQQKIKKLNTLNNNKNNILSEIISLEEHSKLVEMNNINNKNEIELFRTILSLGNSININFTNKRIKYELYKLKKTCINILKNILKNTEKEKNIISNNLVSKITNILPQQGGEFVILSTLIVSMTYVTISYIHFTYIIKVFAKFIFLRCSKETKGLSELEFIGVFIKNNFRDLFIQFIFTLMFSLIGPIAIILNEIVVHFIVRIFLSETINYFMENKNNDGYGQSNLGYFGSLEGVLRDLVNYGNKEELRVPRLSDYPDYRKIEGCINDNFSSYF
jgi:hypothetical protein